MRKLICIVILLSLSICAFAANGNMSLLSVGKINGTQLNAGTYKLTFDGQGDKVQVNIVGKGVKMTVPATVAASDTKLQNSVVKDADGTIREVHLGDQKLIVKFN